MIYRLFSVLVVIWICAANCRAQDPETDRAFEKLQSAITKARLSNPAQGESELLKEIATLANRLETGYRNAKSDGHSEFSQSLSDDAQAISEIIDTADTRRSVLTAVRDDLTLKVTFASRSLNAAVSFPEIINVTVETERDGKVVNGFWLRCNPRRYGVNDHPMFVFNSASSPTIRNLPPGAFVMWVENETHKVLLSEPLDVGSDGLDHEKIKLAVP
jgi:hypothetical protein